jgi:hypothetical protein
MFSSQNRRKCSLSLNHTLSKQPSEDAYFPIFRGIGNRILARISRSIPMLTLQASFAELGGVGLKVRQVQAFRSRDARARLWQMNRTSSLPVPLPIGWDPAPKRPTYPLDSSDPS